MELETTCKTRTTNNRNYIHAKDIRSPMHEHANENVVNQRADRNGGKSDQ